MKRILSLLAIMAFISFAIVSCKDDFNEEDFLKLQSDLKLKQDSILRARNKALYDSSSADAVKQYIAAANEAGDLLAVTLIVRENGQPLSGVSVSLTTGTKSMLSSGRTQAVQTGTTDASGNVVFDRVVIGAGTISFAKSGYITATATVDFGAPSAPTVIQVPNPVTGAQTVRYIAPPKRFEEALVPMFSTSPTAGSTATIRGNVTIENDVTNLTPEVPTGVVIRANLTSLTGPTSGNFIQNFTLADDSSLGVATVNANGTYQMTVPATAAGLNIPLIIPNIEGNCRMAVNGYDNGTGTAVTLAGGPEYRNVPTSWGPQAPTSFGTTVPSVAGARVVIPAPPAAGTGLTFNFAPVPRSLGTLPIVVNSSMSQTINSVTYRINSRGSYGAAGNPSVQVSGGGGSGVTATVNTRSYISALTVTNVGSNYTGNTFINFVRTNGAGASTVLGSITVSPTGAGTLPATINLADFAATAGFAANNQLSLGSDVSSLSVTVTGGGAAASGATVSATFKTEVLSVTINNAGSGFTSAPTFTFSGGGLPAGDPGHAQLAVVDFATQWTVTPNNTASVGYQVLPASFTFSFPQTSVAGATTTTDIQLYSISGDPEITIAGNLLRAQLTVSGGNVVPTRPSSVIRTAAHWSAAPTVVIGSEVPAQATMTIAPNNINSNTGQLIGATANNFGNGYSQPVTATVQPTISGAPGSGATVSLENTFTTVNSEYSWSGFFAITNAGSGYLPNLNQRAAQTASFPANVTTVQPGKTYVVDIVYGTGQRRVAVN